MSRRFWQVLTLLMVFTMVVTYTLPVNGASTTSQTKPTFSLANKAIFFASDGMRPDLMERYVGEGAMPTYSALLAAGQRGDNGMVQAFPPNTGVGWYTLATGAYPGEHGSTNNTYFRSGESSFNNNTSFSALGTLQADTLAAAAERAGKKVAQIDWVGGANAGIAGPTVDYVRFFSTRGVLAAPVVSGEQAGAAAFGISYQVAAFAPAVGWSNVPAGDAAAQPQQTLLVVATSFGAQNPTRTYDVYLYDSVVDGTPAYDHALLVRSTAAKDGSQASVDLLVGDFKEIKLTGADERLARAGQTAGFYTKLITLAQIFHPSSCISPLSSACSQHALLQLAWRCQAEAWKATSRIIFRHLSQLILLRLKRASSMRILTYNKVAISKLLAMAYLSYILGPSNPILTLPL
jgi:hypothetical protein